VVPSVNTSKDNSHQPEIGGDLIRVHRSISRAVEVAYKQIAAAEHPDKRICKGYLTYVRCLVRLLHAHHVTEDKAMFPHLMHKLPHAPIQELTAQHQAMDPVLNKIKDELNYLFRKSPTATKDILEDELYRIQEMWREHVVLEESAYSPDAIEPYLSMEERQKAARITAAHSARHQFPLSLMIPFLLYNMPPSDRIIMLKLMPSIMPAMLKIWKPRWSIMAPFLLKDV
jgi:hemerythrin-like domain-containing protein